ncbi:hypothetical protein [Mucilaginibacter sp. OK098]|uniref:hypothetical protein n=1 Tax=Mucilaginibacter sp. OK098 TaxID=1855297 RepID=UPI001160F824|nr:hypothetical protein [Mucilaginibacter sp. OK098]
MATCLIVLVMYGNFAFVNAAAMERRLNSKAMMLHQFTWQQFLVAAAVLTLVWYGLLFVSWYLKGKAWFGLGSRVGAGNGRSAEPLPHTWERGVDVLSDDPAGDDLMGVSQGPEGLSRVSMDQFSFAAPVERSVTVVAEAEVLERPAVSGGFLQGTVADFLEELKPVFDYAARYKKGLPVFLEHLQALLGRYPEIRESPNWEAIVGHICELAVDALPFEVSPQEIHMFLEQEAE